MKKIAILILAVILYISQSFSSVLAVSDRDILSDPVSNVYTSDVNGEAILTNMSFTDVGNSYWAKEPITRLGALSVVKGYNEGGILSFRPTQSVTNEEALAFLLRVIGQEEASILAAQNLGANEDDSILTIWSRGYLQVASNLGIITGAQLGDGLILDQDQLDPELNFIRKDPATREQVAKWIVDALNSVVPNTIDPINVHQQIFTLGDWESIGNEYLSYVEAVMVEGIMIGDGTNFNPKEPLTRAEMAQIIINIEETLYNTMALKLKAGIVGSIKESSDIGVLETTQTRTILIRNEEGLVDQVDLVYTQDSNNQIKNLDVPVLTGDGVRGLAALKEGDYILYVVDDVNKEMKYVYNKGSQTPVTVKGYLQALDQVADGKVTIKNEDGMAFTYQMVDGLVNDADDTMRIGYVHYPISSLPVGNTVTLTLKNNLVTLIEYEGALSLTMEVSGIIKEINTAFSFVTIESWNGGELTKYYDKNVIVEKENYYDNEDEIGYIDEVFPEYGFDERDSEIDALEVGDIVHLKLDVNNLQYVTHISAKTNYNVKFGQITDIADYGANGLSLRVEYSDQSIGSLDVEATIPVLLRNTNVGVDGLKDGQMVKILLNQGVLAPGRTLETVKQIDIDPYGNMASNIYKGSFGIHDEPKDTISLVNSYVLSQVGWTDFDQMRSLKIGADGVDLYYNGQQVSMNYVKTYLGKPDMNVYAVTETYYDQERVTRMIFEEGRGEVMASTNIAYSNGYDSIRMVNSPDTIGVDEGTIVVKDGHIVSTTSILSPDYAQVVLGDEGSAVVVNVTPEPNNDAISVFRGRIDSIETGEQFNVESNAILKDMEWIYSPIEREFTLSYNTKIIDEDGVQPLNTFIDYSELSKVDEVYTIIAEGTKATHLVKNPYATEGVVGEIYLNETGKLSLKDVLVYDSTTKIWEELSLTNSYAEVEVLTETVIIKNNEVVTQEQLEFGDQIRVMVTVDLSEQLKLESNRLVTGYIIFVEE